MKFIHWIEDKYRKLPNAIFGGIMLKLSNPVNLTFFQFIHVLNLSLTCSEFRKSSLFPSQPISFNKYDPIINLLCSQCRIHTLVTCYSLWIIMPHANRCTRPLARVKPRNYAIAQGSPSPTPQFEAENS